MGAISRYLVSGWVQNFANSNFPFGTLAVNGIGSLLLGLLGGISQHSIVPPQVRLFVGIGIMGAFTTFSTFSYETMMLFKGGAVTHGFLNIGGSLALGLVLVYAGYISGQAIVS